MAHPSEEAVLKTLLMSDLVGSTFLVEQLGDRRAARLFARHDTMARDLLIEHGGREIDKADGFFLIFERPLDAVRYALAYHGALRQMSEDTGLAMAARVGIHLGEVYLRGNPPEHVERGAKPLEVEGLAKPVTARLMSLAGARQTLLTRAAYELAQRTAADRTELVNDVCWQAHGAYRLQGVRRPMRVFEVGIEGSAPLVTPCDVTKIRAVTAPTLWPMPSATLGPSSGRARTLRAMPEIEGQAPLTPDHPRTLVELEEAVRMAARERVAAERAEHRRRRWTMMVAAAVLFIAVVVAQEWRLRNALQARELTLSPTTPPAAAPRPVVWPGMPWTSSTPDVSTPDPWLVVGDLCAPGGQEEAWLAAGLY